MRLNTVVIIVSAVVLAIAAWKRNALPSGIDVDAAVLEDPDQTMSSEPPFEVEFNGVSYRVEPQFRYALNGLVVSYRQHEGLSRMHRRANDHLNMLDVCVVWGGNVDPELLRHFDFWNGIFTCNVKTRSTAAWQAFDMTELSNSHLVSDDPFIRQQAGKLRVGDQVRIEGWLSSYGTSESTMRRTSTTRDDTGNGACETIYVAGIEILKRPRSAWRIAMWVALVSLAISLAVHFRQPYRPYARA
jgi:hypothetical protein